jgi:hypothetical protein
MTDQDYKNHLKSLKKLVDNFEEVSPMQLIMQKNELLKKISLIVDESLNRLEKSGY